MPTWRLRALFALLTLAALALGAAALTSPPQVAVSAQGGAMSGEYRGTVLLRGVAPGVFNATLATPTPPPAPTPPTQLDMQVDLALNLRQAGANVSGFVMLDRTLLYPPVTVIPATPGGPTPRPGTPRPGATPLAIGPRVAGTFDGTTLNLTSDRYEMLMAPARTLINGYTIPEQRVTRQFSLVGTVQDNGSTLRGEYRETVWGYGQQPTTAIGTFSLNRPGFVNVTVIPTSTAGPSPTPSNTPTAGPSPTATRTATASPSPTATSPAGSYHIYLPLLERGGPTR